MGIVAVFHYVLVYIAYNTSIVFFFNHFLFASPSRWKEDFNEANVAAIPMGHTESQTKKKHTQTNSLLLMVNKNDFINYI